MKTRTLISLFAAAAMLLSCGRNTDYLQFLYDSMPLPDSLVFPREYWEQNVAKTLEVRDRMGWDVPEREFRHFVLPLRVNNENLDDFRTAYADSLCARVEGMSMGEAAIEINHWCHERVTYTPSDGRTLGPMAAIKSGLGRCGEESVLTVSALRAAGIPARQVYTPRWAHTDDNHAWVEVYVNGGWHFMGACEPEPVLDLGWFNSSVSRAMLLHTKAFGNYEGPEDVISRTAAYTEINVIKNYVDTRRTSVTVVDEDGNPVEGADLEFKIYNYAEFYTVAKYTTGADGKGALDTGFGDLVVWASKGDRFGLTVAGSEDCKVVLDKTFGERYSLDLDIVPPVENALPNNATPEQTEANAIRLQQEDEIRNARPHPKTYAPELFLAAKDAIDITQEVIADAKAGPQSSDKYIISPRIELEMLMPYRKEILSSGIQDDLHSPADIAVWVSENIKIDKERNPQGLRIPPVAVWRGRIADAHSRDIFFVAFCRTLGFPARIDDVTGMPQYLNDGQWVTVDFEKGTSAVPEQGILHTIFTPGEVKDAQYYTHYTLSKVSEGSCQLCEFNEYEEVSDTNSLDAGYYMMTSGNRLADGSVLAHVELFNLPAGQTVEMPVMLRSDENGLSVIGSMDPEQKFLPEGSDSEASLLSISGRDWFMVCVMGKNGDEPSVHCIGQLSEMAPEINAWGKKVFVLGQARPEGLENAVFGVDTDGKIAGMIRNGMENKEALLPLVIIGDSFGRIVYFSQGYNTSMGQQLSKALKSL